MVHALLGASLLLFLLWIAGLVGALSVDMAWVFLVVSWALGTAWCGAWYQSSWRREHPHHHYRLL
jgi:hypothetical protein